MGEARKLNEAVVAEALAQHRGNMASTAASLGVARQSIRQWVEKSEALKALVAELREARIDKAEDKLDDAVDDREPWAVALMLRTLGRTRGWVDRSESETRMDVTVTVKREDRPPVRPE